MYVRKQFVLPQQHTGVVIRALTSLSPELEAVESMEVHNEAGEVVHCLISGFFPEDVVALFGDSGVLIDALTARAVEVDEEALEAAVAALTINSEEDFQRLNPTDNAGGRALTRRPGLFD